MKYLSAATVSAMVLASGFAAHAQSAPGFYIDGYVQGSYFHSDGNSTSIATGDLDFGIEPGDFSGIFGIDAGFFGIYTDGFNETSWYFAPTAKFGNTKIGVGRTRAASSQIDDLRAFESSAIGGELVLITGGIGHYFNLISDEQYGVLVEHEVNDLKLAVSANRYEGSVNLYSVAAENTYRDAFMGGDLRVFGSVEIANGLGGATPAIYSIGAEAKTGPHTFGLSFTKGQDFVFGDELQTTATYAYDFNSAFSVHAAVFDLAGLGFVAVGGEYQFLDGGFARLNLGTDYGGSSNDSYQDLTIGFRF